MYRPGELVCARGSIRDQKNGLNWPSSAAQLTVHTDGLCEKFEFPSHALIRFARLIDRPRLEDANFTQTVERNNPNRSAIRHRVID